MMPALLNWWQKRQAREQLLALLAAGAVIAGIGDSLLFAPQRAQLAATSAGLKAARLQLSMMQKLASQHSQEGDVQLQERQLAMTARRERSEKVIRDAQVDLIRPQDMATQLAAILAGFPELRVVGMTSSTPTLVGDAVSGAPAGVGLYQHGLEVQVEGRYLALIDYLEALDKAPHRIYWRDLEMKVNGLGVPVTRISFYTLSKEAAWLRI